jgi:hypothetical protein
MKIIHGGNHTTKAWKAALAKVEEQLVRPGADDPKEVLLEIDRITTLPVLFQPREFIGRQSTGGDRRSATDKRFVEKLQRVSNHVGELDPVVVIKITEPGVYGGNEEQWIIVDGHHRLEAYRKSKREKPIKCVWFGGTALEAVDASMKFNTIIKQETSLADRQENAWKRVVAGTHSKKQIVETCAVSEGVVSMMRRVVERFRTRERNNAWKTFKRTIGNIEECSWSNARLAQLNATPKERTLEMRARTLAKNIRSRLTNKLSEDPALTAWALAFYDPDLIGPLRTALIHVEASQRESEEAADNEQEEAA